MTFPLQDPILVFTIIISVILIIPLMAERLRATDLVLLLPSSMSETMRQKLLSMGNRIIHSRIIGCLDKLTSNCLL